jgi:hypothetical protein
MKNTFRLLSLVVILFFVSREIFFVMSENSRDLNEVGVLSSGFVSKINGGKSTVFIEHVLNGKSYSNIMTPKPYGLVLWEKYRILYDPSDPKHFKVLVDQPFFSSDEETSEAIATVLKVTTNQTVQPLLRFEYFVPQGKGMQHYERSQYVSQSFLAEYPNLKKGDKISVRYWLVNPQRAIITLKQPRRF